MLTISTIPAVNLQTLLQFQLIPDMIILIYYITMDVRNWVEDNHNENFGMKVIHSIGTFNIFINAISIALLYIAIYKESLSLAVIYTRFKGTICILTIPIENLYLDEAEHPNAIQTNPSAASLPERKVIWTVYYMLLTVHAIWIYKYQGVLRSQMAYQAISLKRYVEGIYVKYWIYMDALVNINFLATTVVHMLNIFWMRREAVGSCYTFVFDALADFLQYSASFLAAYSVSKRDKRKLKCSFYMRFAALVMFRLNIAISGGERDKTLRRAVITRGVVPEVYSKIFYHVFWLPVARVHSIMILVCLREFIQQLQEEEDVRSNSLPLNLYYSESDDYSNGKTWKSRLKRLEDEDRKVIKLCKLNSRFLKIDPSNCLGSGEFGLVYKGHMGLFLKQDVAIKVARVCIDEDYISCLLFEFKKLIEIGNHENIVKFCGFFRLTTSRFGNLGVVMEYCSLGSLLSYLKLMRHQNLSTATICADLNRFAYEAANGLEYLSSKQLIHGDIACRNLLLSEDKTVKITDFGMSLKLYTHKLHSVNDQKMFPWKWMAPEALLDLQFSIKSDVWSYGVLLWEIFTLGNIPYPGCSWTSEFVEGLKNGNRLEKPDLASEQMYGMMQRCWEYEGYARITFTEVIESFQQLHQVGVNE